MTTPDALPETTPPDPGGTTRMVARCRDDLLALVPTLMGFEPAESVTMLTFGAARPFHARVDLPWNADDDEEVVELLLEPALRHHVARVVLVVHSRHGRVFSRIGRRLVDAFVAAGIGVVEVVRADGTLAWCLDCVEPTAGRGGRCPGHPYDVSAHPFVAEAVLRGRVVHPSREALAETLEPDGPAREAHPRVSEAATRHGARLAAAAHRREVGWLRRSVRRHVELGTRPDDGRLGRLLADLAVVAIRDACWEGMGRARAEQEIELWRDVVRRAPAHLVAPAAGVLAYAAWLVGDGALAWCAVDRGRAHGDLHLLTHVAGLLERAVPPTDQPVAQGAPEGPQVA